MEAQLLGRSIELDILLQALRHTTGTGESSIVLVRGEPGIGKTALLNAFVNCIASCDTDRAVVVGYGQAMTNALGSDAFQAIRECLRSLVSRTERSASKELFGRVVDAMRTHAPDWLESVPVVGLLLAAGLKTGMTVAQSAPKPSLDSRLDQLIALVRELFRIGSVVLVLDDLHWADIATIEILMALALKVQGPLMLVVSYRSDDLRPAPNGEPHPLMRAVFRLRRYRPTCHEIDLHPLCAADTVSLIVSTPGGEQLSRDTASQLALQSGGVPLFAESLAEVHSRGSGAIKAGNPRQITAVVEERLSFAAPEDQRLLEAALAVGFTFEVQFLADLVRTDIDELYDRLDCLVRDHHLIIEAEPVGSLDRYSMAHPLLGQVLRERVESNNARWRRYQRRLVDIFLGQPPSDEMSVRAAMAATAARDPRAAMLCLDAATRQYRAGAVTKARELAGDARRQAKTSGTSAEVSFDAAELFARCLSVEANHREAATVCSETLESAARDSVAAERIWQLNLLHIRSLRMTSQWHLVYKFLDALEAGLPPEAARVRCDILLLRAELTLCGPDQDTQACIQLCDEVGHLTEDVDLLYRAYGHRGLAHLASYQPEESEAWLRTAIDTARREDHPFAEYEALHWLSKKKIACLELEEAWSVIGQLAKTSESSGVAHDSPFHQRDASRVLGLMGNPDRAAEAFLEYFDDLEGYQDQDRALTVLTCQLLELEGLLGSSTTTQLLDSIARGNDRCASHTPAQARLAEAVYQLRDRSQTSNPVDFAVRVLGVASHDAFAAEAIFRFDVADLGRLRRSMASR